MKIWVVKRYDYGWDWKSNNVVTYPFLQRGSAVWVPHARHPDQNVKDTLAKQNVTTTTTTNNSLEKTIELPFSELKNQEGRKIPLEKLTVCYSTHPNLGSLLSYRKICKRTGLKVSSYLETNGATGMTTPGQA